MGTEVSIRKSFKHGFTLNEQELRRIFNILVQQMTEANSQDDSSSTFKMFFKNKITEEKSSIDDVIADSNGGLWEIRSLEINLRNKNTFQVPRISLSFDRDQFRSISYTIEGKDRNWVYITVSLLDERIAMIKPLLLSYFANTIFALSIGFVAGVFLLPLTPFFLPHSSLSLPLGDIVVALFIMILLAVGAITYSYCFPRYNFCWGDYLQIYERKRSVGKFILIGVLFTILLGVIVGVIANYVTVRTSISH